MLSELLEQIKLAFSRPGELWDRLAAGPGETRELLYPQVVLLAALPAAATFLGGVRLSCLLGLTYTLGLFVGMWLFVGLNIALWLLAAALVDGLAVSFGARRDRPTANRLAFAAMLPVWLGQTLGGLWLTGSRVLGLLAGSAYGAYLLYRALPAANGAAQDKAGTYAAVVMGAVFFAALLGSGIVIGATSWNTLSGVLYRLL